MKKLFFLALVAMTGCVPFVPVTDVSKIPEEQLQKAYKIRIFEPGNSANSPAVETMIGKITAYSCKHWMTDPPASKGDALLQLRVKAAEIGANGIIDLTFDTRGTDAFGTNCWESVQASGIAVKFKE